jgi:hypothetical protein
MTRSLTAEEEWSKFLASRNLPEFDTAALQRVVVLAAHPDD